jgi:hypothetical protein
LRTITLLETLALLARFAVAVTAKVAVTIPARLVWTTFAALVLTRLILTLIGALLLLARLLVADLWLRGLSLIVAVLVFEIDVEARCNRITPENFRSRPMGLNGPQKAEIMLGMLQIVFRQNPVPG